MAMVFSEMSVSLDGFVADPSDGVEHLFDWCGTGPVSVPYRGRHQINVPGAAQRAPRAFQVSEASAGHLRELLDNMKAFVAGRRMFDVARGWGGSHPAGVPVFVVTHNVPDGWLHDDAPFTFVTDGVESAVAQAEAVAGDGTVGIGGADITQQCLNAGLLDEIRVNLVPVLLGKGVRLFDNLASTPVMLDDPRVIEGTGVTHLYYRVKSG